jgi:hypothetical protein
MKRMKVLIGKRRVMVIATLAILVLAAAALVASSASFTASSANLSNTFTTGNLTMSNGTISFAAGKLMPGHALAGTVNLTATADGGTASLYMKRTALTGDATLAGKLTLAITESHSTDGGATWSAPVSVYTAAALNDAALAAGNGVKLVTVPDVAAGTQYKFAMTANFPDGGIPTGPANGDNLLKNLSATPTYVFTAISD